MIIIAAILRDEEHKLLLLNKWDALLSQTHEEMCCFHGGGWLEIGKITAEDDILSPHTFVSKGGRERRESQEGDEPRGGSTSHSGAASVVTLL